MRARLHFNSELGTIKTTHRLTDLRGGLPEHKLTCGFWPSCVGSPLLLPKPCWAQLRTNVSACGEEPFQPQCAWLSTGCTTAFQPRGSSCAESTDESSAALASPGSSTDGRKASPCSPHTGCCPAT